MIKSISLAASVLTLCLASSSITKPVFSQSVGDNEYCLVTVTEDNNSFNLYVPKAYLDAVISRFDVVMVNCQSITLPQGDTPDRSNWLF